MSAPRFRPIWSNTIVLVTTGALALTIASSATGTSWQKPLGGYYNTEDRHDIGLWPENLHHYASVHDPECTESPSKSRGGVDTDERLRVWHFGDGDFDRHSTGLTFDELTNEEPKAPGASSKPIVLVKRVREPLVFGLKPVTATVRSEAVNIRPSLRASPTIAQAPLARRLPRNGRALVFLLEMAAQLKLRH